MNDFEAIIEALERIGCTIIIDDNNQYIETYGGFYSWYKFDGNGWLIDSGTYSEN